MRAKKCQINVRDYIPEEPKLIYKDETFQIIGAAIEVHTVLGPGFLESVYEAAMLEELKLRNIPAQSQVKLTVFYKEEPLSTRFIADLVAFGKIIVEYKTSKRLTEIDEAQVINYLKATGMRLGLLINFASHGRLEWKRFVL
jgi:GxxExxY protein